MCIPKVLKTTTSTPPPLSPAKLKVFSRRKSHLPTAVICNWIMPIQQIEKKTFRLSFTLEDYFLQPRIRKSLLKVPSFLSFWTIHVPSEISSWGLVNDMQMSMYNRKHWHALSHSLHIVRHEGRLATNGRTRLTRSMEANEPGFFIYPLRN